MSEHRSSSKAPRKHPADEQALQGRTQWDAMTGLPEMLGTRECQIAVLNWGNGHGWPAGPCYYARL
jgi:hypothetical protein